MNHDRTRLFIQGSLFVAYWPATYYIARRIRPASVGFLTVFYYLGVYKYGLDRVALNGFQSSLNTQANQFAEKYGIK
eukprot:CAMPEP_0170564552 /NCGR_PEP_ID=MMETSP0211-20121228/73544_1 /TAXON_ID=311385 /ORGANISM="Pseudokeronopsis sp., Strain OXSARD2" /LENGTH=76 /DNA_ID=CAMNT_0010884175 /DNA_START=233 /DNA_END=460 /DNA_ORIENTATION=+